MIARRLAVPTADQGSAAEQESRSGFKPVARIGQGRPNQQTTDAVAINVANVMNSGAESIVDVRAFEFVKRITRCIEEVDSPNPRRV